MKHLLVFVYSLLILSCTQPEIVEYSGQVFTYTEEPGIKKNYEFIRDVGIPLPNVDVWVKHRDQPVNAVNCCWGFEPVIIESESHLGHTITDTDGRYLFSAELDEGASVERTFVGTAMSHTVFGSDIYVHQTNRVDIKFISNTPNSNHMHIKLFIDRDHIPGSHMTQLILTDLDRTIENSTAIYSTQVILMNNINLSYAYTVNDGETIRGQFFTGDQDNPTGLWIDI